MDVLVIGHMHIFRVFGKKRMKRLKFVCRPRKDTGEA